MGLGSQRPKKGREDRFAFAVAPTAHRYQITEFVGRDVPFGKIPARADMVNNHSRRMLVLAAVLARVVVSGARQYRLLDPVWTVIDVSPTKVLAAFLWVLTNVNVPTGGRAIKCVVFLIAELGSFYKEKIAAGRAAIFELRCSLRLVTGVRTILLMQKIPSATSWREHPSTLITSFLAARLVYLSFAMYRAILLAILPMVTPKILIATDTDSRTRINDSGRLRGHSLNLLLDSEGAIGPAIPVVRAFCTSIIADERLAA